MSLRDDWLRDMIQSSDGSVATAQEIIGVVADKVLGIDTLEVRGSDSLDFHEVGVASLREALYSCYILGKYGRRSHDADQNQA